MNISCMLYLQQKGLLDKSRNKILDIGPQNVYFATQTEIRDFIDGQGVSSSDESLNDVISKIEYFSTPRPEERTTMFSDITEIAGVEYKGFDVCPAPYTDIVDLNFDRLVSEYKEHFDVVLNFGTTEHIFNQWNSFEVIHDATKVGGVIYCVLPMSGYLDHGYYCYTPLFFEDLAKSNGYEFIDLFISPAGLNDVKAMGIDVRDNKQILESNTAIVSPGDERIPQYNIHAVMRKTRNAPFSATLEVATAHSAVNDVVAARYGGGDAAAEHKDDFGINALRGGDMRQVVDVLLEMRRSHTRTADEFRTQIEKETARADRLETATGNLRREKESLGDEVVRLKQHIEAIRTSTSWRLTGPLRIIGRMFK